MAQCKTEHWSQPMKPLLPTLDFDHRNPGLLLRPGPAPRPPFPGVADARPCLPSFPLPVAPGPPTQLPFFSQGPSSRRHLPLLPPWTSARALLTVRMSFNCAYSTGSSARCSVMTWAGGMREGVWEGGLRG